MRNYLSRESNVLFIAIFVSIIIHIALFSIFLTAFKDSPVKKTLTKIDLVFAKIQPTPAPPAPKAKPKPKPAPKPKKRIKPMPAPRPAPKPAPKPKPEPETVLAQAQPTPEPPAPEPSHVVEAEAAMSDGVADAPAESVGSATREDAYVEPPYAPECGNGIIDEGEECDDGNPTDGDGCSATCGMEVDVAAILAEYQKNILRMIERNKRYPRSARRRGVQGATRVAFTIFADGSRDGVALERTSGNDALDAEALDAIRRTPAFPPLPPETGYESLAVSLSIVFELR